MGISISYSGDLNDPSQIDNLIADLKRKCRKIEWPCEEVDDRILGQAYRFRDSEEVPTETPGRYVCRTHAELAPIDERVRGVRIQPPGTETFYLTFNRAGHLCSYVELQGRLIQETPGVTSFTPEPGYYMEFDEPWVKTTGAVRSHRLIVSLLRYVQAHYVHNLQVNDEAAFWETRDVDELTQEHRMMSAVIGLFQEEDAAKTMAELVGLEDVNSVEPVDTNIEVEKPEWTKEWGTSAGEN